MPTTAATAACARVLVVRKFGVIKVLHWFSYCHT
uniref:Uncharacterized protein n=1 Tax=Anopheles arabiensis TaxID=7173 RepID=A0A182IG72_ANOAR